MCDDRSLPGSYRVQSRVEQRCRKGKPFCLYALLVYCIYLFVEQGRFNLKIPGMADDGSNNVMIRMIEIVAACFSDNQVYNAHRSLL
jgi:hypothetical protein